MWNVAKGGGGSGGEEEGEGVWKSSNFWFNHKNVNVFL